MGSIPTLRQSWKVLAGGGGSIRAGGVLPTLRGCDQLNPSISS